jgi:TolB-like protein/Flp pilus assembly protein TadD
VIVRLISELRRRNVVRTTLAYIAGSWLLVQVADIVLPTFDVASWAMQSLIVLLAAGLPVVIGLAWIYDLTPEGMERTPDDAPQRPPARPLSRKIDFVIIGVLSVALIMMQINQHIVPGSSVRLGSNSLIVLPFSTNQGEDGSLLADGLLGEILSQLYKIEGLKTVGRATAMHYRGTDKSIGAIADEVGVATVLSGNIIEVDEVARLDVELLEAGSGAVLWGDSYVLAHSVQGLFRVQTDIAARIANALEAEISPPEQAPPDDTPQTNEIAYSHYIRGQGFALRTRLQEAIDAFEQATTEDPEFALAWAALARARVWGSFTGLADTTMAEAEFALEQARRLAPDAVDTLFAEASVASGSNRLDEANEKLNTVLKLRPGDPEPLVELAGNYTIALELGKALEYAERAVALDPMDIQATWQVAFVNAWSWNFEEARRYYDRVAVLETEPPHSWRFWMRYQVYLWGFGDTAAAQRILDEAPATISTDFAEAQLAYLNRDFRKARDLLDATAGDQPHWYELQARLHRLTGNVEAQRESAERLRVATESQLESLLARGATPVDVESARSNLAVAHALAGNGAEALRVISLAVERAEPDPDRLNAVPVYVNEVHTHALLGQTETAIERLRALLSWATPAYLTPARLRMDPAFDDLRGHPEFEAVLEEVTARMN